MVLDIMPIGAELRVSSRLVALKYINDEIYLADYCLDECGTDPRSVTIPGRF
jgi:hypothetical protein